MLRIVLRTIQALGLGALAIVGLGLACMFFGLRVVDTDSLPRGLYWVHQGQISRGSIVAFCLPPAVARAGLIRGYLPQGQCPSGTGQLAKIVAGLNGDQVIVSNSGVYINNRCWPWSTPVRFDSRGRSLAWRARKFIIPKNMILVLGLNKASWDSRYYGPIPMANVENLVYPIAIEPGPASKVLHQQYLRTGIVALTL